MTEDEAPYEVPTMRLKSLRVKDVTVKKEPAMRVTVAWERQMPDGSWDAMRYSSVRDPHGDFWLALCGLVPHAIAILELPAEYGRVVEVVGVKMSYDDEEHQIATVLLRKLTSTGPALIETPALPASGDYEHLQTAEYHRVLTAAEAEALQFAANIGA